MAIPNHLQETWRVMDKVTHINHSVCVWMYVRLCFNMRH